MNLVTHTIRNILSEFLDNIIQSDSYFDMERLKELERKATEHYQKTGGVSSMEITAEMQLIKEEIINQFLEKE